LKSRRQKSEGKKIEIQSTVVSPWSTVKNLNHEGYEEHQGNKHSCFFGAPQSMKMADMYCPSPQSSPQRGEGQGEGKSLFSNQIRKIKQSGSRK
jgi:hypothetical protein